MRSTIIGMAAAIAASAPAAAAVKSVTAQGFAVESTVSAAVTPAQAFAALIRPALWWSSAHTFSQDSANLTLDPRAGGCFCEKIPNADGQVEHMRVVNIVPGRLLRLRGALGPLQGEGVDGALTWTLKATPAGTEIGVTYVIGGYLTAGMDALAAPVDRVIGEQLTRLKAYAEGRKP